VRTFGGTPETLRFQHACFYNDVEGFVDLNTRIVSGPQGWILESAVGINDLGEIVGEARVSQLLELTRGFKLVPVDVPAPVISASSAKPNVLWPPDGHLVPVQFFVDVTDNKDPSAAVSRRGRVGFGGGERRRRNCGQWRCARRGRETLRTDACIRSASSARTRRGTLRVRASPSRCPMSLAVSDAAGAQTEQTLLDLATALFRPHLGSQDLAHRHPRSAGPRREWTPHAACAAKTREQLARIYGRVAARAPIRIRGLPGLY
jgi:hypothetical protein